MQLFDKHDRKLFFKIKQARHELKNLSQKMKRNVEACTQDNMRRLVELRQIIRTKI